MGGTLLTCSVGGRSRRQATAGGDLDVFSGQHNIQVQNSRVALPDAFNWHAALICHNEDGVPALKTVVSCVEGPALCNQQPNVFGTLIRYNKAVVSSWSLMNTLWSQ